MKPIEPPATGPYMAASRARTAYCRLMLVLGTGLGMATKRPRTKNNAAPIPTATTVLMLLLLFFIFSLLFYSADAVSYKASLVYDTLLSLVNGQSARFAEKGCFPAFGGECLPPCAAKEHPRLPERMPCEC